jgi:hypothetical protein
MASLTRKLLQLLADGTLAGTEVFEIAAAAWDDGWGRNCPTARKLVQAGRGGLRRFTIADDILRAADADGFMWSLAKPYSFPIGTGGNVEMYLPHEFIPKLVGDDLASWCLPADQLAAATGLGALLRQWAAHPDVQFAGNLQLVPIVGFHADGTQYNRNMRAGSSRSIVAGSMSVISTDPQRARRRQPLFVVRKIRLCSCGCMERPSDQYR